MCFTIISNNCWAGLVYQHFGLPYNTPTAGLFFFAQDYLEDFEDDFEDEADDVEEDDDDFFEDEGEN